MLIPSADNLDEALELAIHNSTFSPFDSDAVQYFAARELQTSYSSDPQTSMPLK
jgi:hypothetical protein